MKVIFCEQARAIWLFQMQELNPSGKYLYPLLGELIKRYKFAGIPNISEAIKKNEGIMLTQGAFTHKDMQYDVDLGIYNDGLIADSKATTDISEGLLEDLLLWAQKEYGLQYPKQIRKQFISKLHLECPPGLAAINEKLNQFALVLAEKAAPQLGKVRYELSGITLTTEQTTVLAPPLFSFERSARQPHSLNRYFSGCGFQTKAHLELLERLEVLLT